MAGGDREMDGVQRENEELRRQLTEANDTLRAIRSGEVDALVVRGQEGHRLYTLESAYEPYRVFVEQMQQGAASLTPDGLILYSNKRFAQILGVAGDRLLGTSIYSIIDEAHHKLVEVLLTATPDRPQDGEMVIARSDGHQVHALFLLTAMPDGTRCAVVTDVTERVRQRELLASKEWLQVTLASIGDCVVSCDTAGRITFLNSVAETVTGWPRAEALGQPIETVFRIVNELTHEPLEDLVRRVLRDGEVIQLGNHAALVTRDGREVPISDSAAPIRDKAGNLAGAVLVFQDATRRRDAQRALQESEARYREREADLARSQALAHLGSWRWNVVDDTVAWSQELYRIFGVDPCTFVPSNEAARSLIHPDDQAAQGERVRKALSGERIPAFESRIIRPNGEERTVLASGFDVEFDEAGKPTALFGTILDITDQKRAEEALHTANAQLAEASRNKDEFIAILSHELRNPLAPIRYALPVLQAQKVDDAGNRAIAVIDRQVDHLTRLVDDLLDVSRITRGKIELRQEHITLASVVTAAAEAASPAMVAARHNLKITVPDEPIWLHGDAARISQVITNLLNNSAKYTPRGGEIVVATERVEGHVVIRVRDNGIGIPREALPTIFDMFTQVPRPDRSPGGLGIGLALVKRLVEMHDGTIEVQSGGAGEGAEFVIRLPIAAEVHVTESVPPRSVATEHGRLRVLIVDDNADLVDMLAIAVENAGHEVRKALDGRSAISAALSYRPDVVLLDLGLPVMSGLEVAKELKRQPETAGAQLVALTGWGGAEDKRLTEEAGFEHHLTKPTDPKMVERLLAQFAARRRP